MVFPVKKYCVVGSSMHPAFKNGDEVLASSLAYIISPPKKGEVVVLLHPSKGIPILKRITRVTRTKLFVEGDNLLQSTDSNEFGFIPRKNILGKVLYSIPKN